MINVITNERTLRVFSVSDLSFSLKRTLEETFSHVRVKGELSGVKAHSSGHLYFSIKDEAAVLDAICWKGVVGTLPLKPQDGMEVILTGRITTYPGRSKYQITVSSLEASGEGTLLKLLEERKKKLAKEGIFDPQRKKKLPFLPNKIGVITSPTGAVIKDILHRLVDRMPTHVLLWPVAVQGQTAHEEITKAILGFNALPESKKPDVLIVARGGGSLEDLWAFNEEDVVRATAASSIPIISAVGHETDTTLIDYASDYRAPTPTAAAEKSVPVRADLLMILLNSTKRMVHGSQRCLNERALKLESLSRGIPSLAKLAEDYTQRVDDWADRLKGAYRTVVKQRDVQVSNIGKLLTSYSYQGVLKRGFTLVKNAKGQLVTHKAQAPSGSSIQIMFQDGTVKAVVDGKAVKPKKTKTSPPSSQPTFWD